MYAITILAEQQLSVLYVMGFATNLIMKIDWVAY